VKNQHHIPSIYSFKISKNIDVYEPIDHDIFNMGVHILAPNALEKAKDQ
jgi:hypothetical protein